MASLAPLPSRIHYGAFDLDVASGELRKSGIPIKLRRQAVEVLIMLTNRAGQVVTREEIRERLWSNDTFVDFERSINFCINQIRGALGDNAEKPRYVETLPRQGYRFITPVTVKVRSEPTTPLTIVPYMDSEPAVKPHSLPAWIRPAIGWWRDHRARAGDSVSRSVAGEVCARLVIRNTTALGRPHPDLESRVTASR